MRTSLTLPQKSINMAIFTFAIYIPLALFIIMGLLFSKYDLEKIYPQIVEELRVRRAEKDLTE